MTAEFTSLTRKRQDVY